MNLENKASDVELMELSPKQLDHTIAYWRSAYISQMKQAHETSKYIQHMERLQESRNETST